MAREFKNYELKASPRPIKTGRYRYLSSTVAIRGLDGRSYYCYVSFSDKLVHAVGKKLPRGIYEYDPAYLYVLIAMDGYHVYARYAAGPEPAPQCLLWSGSLTDTPDWLSFHQTKD